MVIGTALHFHGFGGQLTMLEVLQGWGDLCLSGECTLEVPGFLCRLEYMFFCFCFDRAALIILIFVHSLRTILFNNNHSKTDVCLDL